MKFSLAGTMNMPWETVRDAARCAEELGFDEFYTSDHLMAVAGFDEELGILDAVALLPALATQTRRIRLGSLVSPITFRNPAILLRQLHTVDVISGGRAIVGIGAGWSDAEHAAFGFPFPPVRERLAGLEAACRLLRERWGRERPAAPQASPYILVAGASNAAMASAARHADAWNGMGSPAFVAAKVAQLRAAERNVERGLPQPVEATLNLIAIFSADQGLLDSVKKRMANRSANRVQAATVMPDEQPSDGVYMGAPEGLRARLAEYQAAGIQRVILTAPRPFSREALQRLAQAAGMQRVV